MFTFPDYALFFGWPLPREVNSIRRPTKSFQHISQENKFSSIFVQKSPSGHTIFFISFGKSNTLWLLYEISCFATLCGQLGQGGLSGILSIGEKYLASHTKSLSALSLFVNLGNSEESLVSVLAAATLALLCFAIDPRQSDIHTMPAFSKIAFLARTDWVVFFSRTL